MIARAKVAVGLWILLAVIVFNVRFDWQARVAGHAFVRSQLSRAQHGQPTISINDGFRPMIREAALEAGGWFLLIAAAGSMSSWAAARRQRAA